jgi:hypothetical protein
VVANGDEDYAELVKSVRAETDGTEVTVEILEVILRGFAEVKKKKAMRARAQDIAETMIDSGVGTFEDFRDADEAWLRSVCGLPHFEAKALVKFLQACPYTAAVSEAAAMEGEELEEAAPAEELEVDDEEELDGFDFEEATSQERQQQREEEELQQQGGLQGGQGTAGANPMPSDKRLSLSGGTTVTEASQERSAAVSMAMSVVEMAAKLTEGQLALQAAAQHAARGKVEELKRDDLHRLPSVAVTVKWLKSVKRVFGDVQGMQDAVEQLLQDPRNTLLPEIADPGGHVCNLVRTSMEGVFEEMGGGERARVGTLLRNTLAKAIDKKQVVKTAEYLRLYNFPVIAGSSRLKEQWEGWTALVWEVRWTDLCSEEFVLESAGKVFQRFQPMWQASKEKYKAILQSWRTCSRPSSHWCWRSTAGMLGRRLRSSRSRRLQLRRRSRRLKPKASAKR